jgi:hypothetical protein
MGMYIRNFESIKMKHWASRVAQVVVRLPSKHKALSLKPQVQATVLQCHPKHTHTKILSLELTRSSLLQLLPTAKDTADVS